MGERARVRCPALPLPKRAAGELRRPSSHYPLPSKIAYLQSKAPEAGGGGRAGAHPPRQLAPAKGGEGGRGRGRAGVGPGLRPTALGRLQARAIACLLDRVVRVDSAVTLAQEGGG